jgi:DNA-binding MarR family transcriptional regulator
LDLKSATSNGHGPPGAVCDEESLARLAEIIMMLQRCFLLRLSEELSAGQVTAPQYFLLGHLDGPKNLAMGEIAAKMNHSMAASSGLVDRLEGLGYVRRVTSEADRRRVLVSITDKGIELVGRIRQDIRQNLDNIMATLTPHERKMWLQIYEKIYSYCQMTTDPSA